MLISFGICSKKLFIPFIFPIFVEMRRFFRHNYGDQYNIEKNPYIRVFINFLSLTLCIFLYFIVKCKTKNNTKKKSNKNKEVRNLSVSSSLIVMKINDGDKELIDLNEDNDKKINPIQDEQNKIKKNQQIKQFFFIIFISFLQITSSLIQNIWKKEQNFDPYFHISVGIIFEIIFMTFFSVIFLKFSVYLHQKFSFLIIVICLGTFSLEKYIIVDNEDKNTDIYIIIIYFFIIQLLFCLSNVLGKKYLDLYIENIYYFLFKIGIIGLIPLFLYDLIIDLIWKEDKTFHGIIPFFNFLIKTPKQIYAFFLDLLFSFLWEIGLWMTMYHLSPCHFIISETLAEFIHTTLHLSQLLIPDNYRYFIIISFFILYLMTFFCILVFNELILLNFCGLSYNTEYQIILREKVDGIYDVDKNGKLIPLNRGNKTTYIEDEEEEDNNGPLF